MAPSINALHAAATCLLLFFATLPRPVCPFAVPPAFSCNQLARSSFSRISRLPARRVDDDDEIAAQKDTEKRKPDRLFSHDDWVEYRSSERKMNDLEDLMLPFVAVFVLYFCFVAVVI